jgi:hypothetical protein
VRPRMVRPRARKAQSTSGQAEDSGHVAPVGVHGERLDRPVANLDDVAYLKLEAAVGALNRPAELDPSSNNVTRDEELFHRAPVVGNRLPYTLIKRSRFPRPCRTALPVYTTSSASNE